MRSYVKFPSGREIEVDIESRQGKTLVTVAGRTVEADVNGTNPRALSVRVGDRMVDLTLEGDASELGVIASGARFYASVETEQSRALAAALGTGGGAGAGLVKSPMPGRVLKLLAAEGDEVTQGTPLVVVEAMKMENELFAPKTGKISRIFVTAGATVESGAKLVEIT